MNRRVLLIVAVFTCTLFLPFSSGAKAIVIEERGVVGGLSLSTTSNGEISESAEEWPRIVEVYTATWCQNCVPAEHSLESAIGEEDVITLFNHRWKDESEDPFGSEAGDERWEELYGPATKQAVGVERAAPTMVFEGHVVKAGSSATGDSLEADYRDLLATTSGQPTTGQALTSGFSWQGNNSTGTLSWNFTAQYSESLMWSHRIMVIEETAYFPEGSNRLENYTHIVRGVINLVGDSGSQSVELPAAWDGDDLSLVLVHEWLSNAEPCCDDEPEEESGFMPASGLTALLIAGTAAALVGSRDE